MRLILVLSFGGSLRRWAAQGILTREIEIYLQYLAHGMVDRLYIFTYGHDDDVGLIDAPPGLLERIVLVRPERPLASHWARLIYSLDVRRIWAIGRAGVDLAKTNQISGSWVALLLRLAGVRIFARCGYVLSRSHIKSGRYGRLLLSYPLEWLLFSAADLISVTTEAAAHAVRRRIRNGEKVFVAPTYVDTDVFKADAAAKTIADCVIFVGRLETPKNLLNLVKACRACDMGLHIVGTGSLAPAVAQLAAAIGADVRIIGNLSNNEIARLFQSYKYYALPSLYEGLPKSLIEAMSSEMICIGTNVPGITDLLTDGVTGYLSDGLDDGAIAEAIRRARRDPAGVDVARLARAFVVSRHSIAAYLERERSAINRWVLPRMRRPSREGLANG